jgi:hypothetical protein
MIKELTLKSYEYLMIETFKRIKENKHYDVNFKPYSKELLKNLLTFFEEREEYEKCKMIHEFIESRYNHELNYKNII